MQLSSHNWMRAEPIERTIERLSEAGFDSIEISGEPDQYDTSHVLDLLDKYDLDCWGSVTIMVEDRDLIASDTGKRERSVQYAKDCVTMIEELDGEILTIVPSTVGKVTPEARPEQEWEWALESLGEIYDHAQSAGVKICIEPLNRFETYFIRRGEQAMELAEAVGPDCGVALDTFHMNIEESAPYEAFRTCADRLTDVHVADNNRMACGMGTWDWPRVVDILDDIGYDGALTNEFVAPVDRTPANPYPDATEEDPDELTPEQKKFIEDHGSDILTDEFYTMLIERTSETLLPLLRD